jgi:predicted metalloprotease
VKFGNRRVSTGRVDDLRGRGVSGSGVSGRGIAVGGGAGIGGLLLFLLITLLGGGGGTGGAPADGTVTSTSDLATRCNTPGALRTYDDCFLVKVFDETQSVWQREFARLGKPYRAPRLAFFSGQVSTGCGTATSQVGPFYCPPDERIYLDIDFLAQLQRQFGAPGRYAQAYVLAHEFGHHIQTLLGIEQQVRQAQSRDPDLRNQWSIALELQADCLAGVWGKLADEHGNVTIGPSDLAQAQNAAAAVGDDRIQAKVQGQVDPETWTHGSAQQREQSYTQGFDGGTLAACPLASP